MSRKIGPLDPMHPSVGTECAACRKPIAAGAYMCLVPLGPGDDPEEQARARVGRPYNAVAVLCHWACVTGGDP